jgi:flavin reductase (DIM6/NTAB) family NADH-FMN oxidoreductase RutF
MPLELTQRMEPTVRVAPSSDYAEAMSVLASGVVMVTTELAARPWGMTVSAFASVSAEPPTILVSLHSETAAARAIAQTRGFGVSILGRQHSAAAHHGATRGAAKFLEPFVDRHGEGGNPAIAGALAHLECEVVDQVEVADHTILFARVREVRGAKCGEPLVYFRRAYRTLIAHGKPSLGRRSPCLSS